ncbi:MAG: DUF488 domain-containing protein [Candidatus Wallbacteria bacterium]|nr:DUF488 domain-containing protein [Candidatus Wallbacteria bacterium]
MKFYSIGYGGRSPDELLATLTENGVKSVADVRIAPYAAIRDFSYSSNPEKGISALLKSRGIDYIHLEEMGNLLRHDPDWQRKYSLLWDRCGDLLTGRLFSLQPPFCLLCAERKIKECHRLIIADYLVKLGHEAVHIS